MKKSLIRNLIGVSFAAFILCPLSGYAAELLEGQAHESRAKQLGNQSSQSREAPMDIEVIKECSRLSLEGDTPFPEIVQRLAKAGVTSYRVDLVRLEKTTYGTESQSYNHIFKFEGTPSIPNEFNAEEVIRALRDIQGQKIKYVPFLQRIMEAGTSHYEVFINGQKTIYTGRNGDFYVENFPGAK